MDLILLFSIAALSLATLAVSFFSLKSPQNHKQDKLEEQVVELQKQLTEIQAQSKNFEEKQNTCNTAFATKLENFANNQEKTQERIERGLKDELVKNRERLEEHAKDSKEEFNNHTKTSREDFNTYAKYSREDMNKTLNDFRSEITVSMKHSTDTLSTHMRDLSKLQQEQLKAFAEQLKSFGENFSTEIYKTRETMESRLKHLQDDNNKKLEQMRLTVDEKLHSTLEKRLSESFKSVTDMLEQVYKGLGEMQSLATGVGDLKKVLSNVKTRGTWGEIQLGSLLEQILTIEQFEQNVGIKASTTERVDFAIKLPGTEEKDGHVWLPIDAKFPQEDYQKLVEVQETGDKTLYDQASKQLEARIKLEAKSIRDKYIDPPRSTDFAIMFLPIEGLYAEVLRRPGLAELLQRDYRVIIAGPTTLAALLNSLQMGFRTLAIEKRSSEVWQILAGVKLEFGKFGDILEKTQKKLQEASNTIETASRKSRTIERKLRKVEELPDSSSKDPAQMLLGSDPN